MKKRKIWIKKGSLIMTQDMTQGKIMPMLVHFTIPLVLGNLFQLTYNAVDSIIVGHFCRALCWKRSFSRSRNL